MKNTTIVLLFCLISAITYSQNPIEGLWQPEGKDAIFKIYEENGKFYGQLIGSNNPEEDLKIKEKDKIILLRDLQEESKSEYCCGIFISPEKKKKVSASLTLKNDNTVLLKIKKGWFRKSIVWKRI
jgi:uncharacterized protein (DUF2147 family)